MYTLKIGESDKIIKKLKRNQENKINKQEGKLYSMAH